jgi:hypothetical protein
MSVVRSTLSLAALMTFAITSSAAAQTGYPPDEYATEATRYTANQLDNLVGPVALYPDALLAQVLVAATFPDQVEDAAQFVRTYGTSGIDDQPWDISVKAIAHYPSALNMMADKSDWTAALGIAYAYQSSDVMAAVQRMRALASEQGNLVSNDQQQVVQDNSNYVIVPANPRVIYVPVYDPVVIYTRPIFRLGISSRYWSFGIGFPIGGWLTYDLDWPRRTVYYNGWSTVYASYAGNVWRSRARPYIHITNVYVNPRYRTVYVNRDVGRRVVNYGNVERYGGYHRDTRFDNRRNDPRNGRDYGRDYGRANDGRDRGNGTPVGRTAEPRSAQPRNGQPVARPGGYSNGSRPDNVNGNTNTSTRGNNNGDRSRNGNDGVQRTPPGAGSPNPPETRGGSRNPNEGRNTTPTPQRGSRPEVQAPTQRRSEPQRGATPRLTPVPPATPARTPVSRVTPTRSPTSRATPARTPTSRATPARTPTSRATPARTPTSRATPARTPTTRATQASAPRSAQPRGSSGGSGRSGPPAGSGKSGKRGNE